MKWTPEKQMDIFEALDALPVEDEKPKWMDSADWKTNPLYPHMTDRVCEVLVIIPDAVLSPLELPGSYESKLKKMQLWSAYVNAISCGSGIKFSDASELLEIHRNEKRPVKIRLTERFAEIFEELEVVQYL